MMRRGAWIPRVCHIIVLLSLMMLPVVADSSPNNTTTLADACYPGFSGFTSEAEDSWPAPIITSLYPGTIAAGMPAFTLTVGGNYFLPDSRVLWDWRDRTKAWHSVYQMTAEIQAGDITTPGTHYLIVQNPSECGGDSNITMFDVIDDGQTFPMAPEPRITKILRGSEGTGSFVVESLSDGLDRFNLTLYQEESAPFTFYVSELPSWITNPEITWIDGAHLQISGSDANNRISNESADLPLVNVSILGSANGTSLLHCVLNEAVGDSGSRYGSGYTAMPIEIRQLLRFPSPDGGLYPMPRDLTGDGLYQDLNGNARLDFNDIVTYFANTGFITRYQPMWALDYDRNGVCNLNDVVILFQQSTS